MKNTISLSLIFFIITTGCTGPGGLFGDDDSEDIPFEYDLTIEDMWNDIPITQTSASDLIKLT